MLLSIIIVNYNVKHFLEQCLYSLQEATRGIDAEIIIVDNNSGDNSLAYLRPKFPGVIFQSNKNNAGFAKACNQGLERSQGEYVLFLNPDTIVPEDCFTRCLSFFQSHPEAGALGVRMVDGSGQFLKESKRAFPSPMTSLYKLFGLAKLFPHSRSFSRYHLGHLSEHATNEVDVLAGAFMMIRRKVLNELGSFDEVFFMYGEDVDLSYRIQKAGYKNYYFADTSVVHFKGESTRKASMNYVRMFYNAMSIFVRKHYGGSRAGIFNFLIHLAIWVRAGLTAIGHFIRRAGLPLIDAGIILLSFWLVKNTWNAYIRTDIQYENKLLWIAFPAYTIFYLITAYYAGLYDRWYKRSELVRASIIATLVLLAGYALLPEQFRFSRGIILFGALLAFLLISIFRWILIRTGVLSSNREKEHHYNTIIIGTDQEYQHATSLLQGAGLEQRILGRMAVDNTDSAALGNWQKLKKLSATIPFREIIFCQGKLTFREIIDSMQDIPRGTVAKIHAHGSSSIVGSNSKDSSGESVSNENGFNLADPYYRRLKRLIDVSISVLGIISFPIQLFLVKRPGHFFSHCLAVLFAQKTWVGYALPGKGLPHLHKAVLACNGVPLTSSQQLPEESLQVMDYWYARDYEPATDLKMIKKMYRRLGG